MAANSVTASLIAENTFTEWINPKQAFSKGIDNTHFMNISVAGTWSGTATLQRRFGSSDFARDVANFLDNAEESLYDHEEGVEYRLGIKTGNYTSGTCIVRLGA